MILFAYGDTEIDAALLRARLEAHGIQAFTHGSMFVRTEVHIPEFQRDDALKAIEAERIARTHCPGCGYDMAGLAEGSNCPECNAETKLPESGTPRFHLAPPPASNPLLTAVGMTVGMIALLLLLAAIVAFIIAGFVGWGRLFTP